MPRSSTSQVPVPGQAPEHHHGTAEWAGHGSNGPKENGSPVATAYADCSCSSPISSSQQLVLGNNTHLGENKHQSPSSYGWLLMLATTDLN